MKVSINNKNYLRISLSNFPMTSNQKDSIAAKSNMKPTKSEMKNAPVINTEGFFLSGFNKLEEARAEGKKFIWLEIVDRILTISVTDMESILRQRNRNELVLNSK